MSGAGQSDRPARPPEVAPGSTDPAAALSALARFAELPLPAERAEALLTALETARREHAALRGLPLGLEAHVVFDPRWD